MRAVIYFLLRRRPSIRVMCCDCAHYVRQFQTEPHVSLCGVVPRPSFILGSWVERAVKEQDYLRTRHFCSMANPRGFCPYFKPKPLPSTNTAAIMGIAGRLPRPSRILTPGTSAPHAAKVGRRASPGRSRVH